MATKYWGKFREINEIENENIPDITCDIERAMNPNFLSEFDDGDDDLITIEKIMLGPLNPLMHYTISLHKYANKIVELKEFEETNKSGLTERKELIMPVMNEEISYKVDCLNCTAKDLLNTEVELPVLSREIVRQIVVKCVATMFAHIGYETCQQSALDVLVDIVQDFYKTVSHHLKIALQDEEQQMAGFPNVIERVLSELGMGGVKGLDDYYKARVVKYATVLENRCKDLKEEYNTLLLPKAPSPIDKVNKVVRVKVEEEDVVEVENSEVHFSTIDGDVNSILEPGYQLLKSLEAEDNLQSLSEGVEDISTTESPDVGSSEEISHLSPYNNKKKRFK